MAKVVTKICNILSALILVVIIGVLCILLVPKIFGYDTYAVLSGSMEPTYHVGSIVYVDKVSADTIKVNDPIAFRIDQKTVATHRVVKIDKEKKLFYTKGDANTIRDQAPVPFAKVIGKGTKSIDRLGFIAMNMKTKKGILAGVFLLLFVVVLYMIPELLKKPPKEEETHSKESLEKNTTEHVSM